MKIHQISVTYIAEQDRILGRFNTANGDELRMWLTRRLCLAFTPTITRAVADLVANKAGAQSPLPDDLSRRMLADFQREDAIKKGDFKTPYRREVSTFPLGEEPLVITDVHISHTPEGALQVRFDERLDPAQPRGFQVVMENDLMHGFIHLLEKSLERSEWHASNPTAGKSAKTDEAPEGAADDKPTYLN